MAKKGGEWMNETRYRLDHLRAWREHKEMSQADLALRAGVGRVTITRLEAQRTEANGVTVAKLARGLDITRDELFTEPPASQKAPAIVTSGRKRGRGTSATPAASA